jgi:hypothetical protein
VVELVDWTLRESGLGAPRLHRNGKDSDPRSCSPPLPP